MEKRFRFIRNMFIGGIALVVLGMSCNTECRCGIKIDSRPSQSVDAGVASIYDEQWDKCLIYHEAIDGELWNVDLMNSRRVVTFGRYDTLMKDFDVSRLKCREIQHDYDGAPGKGCSY